MTTLDWRRYAAMFAVGAAVAGMTVQTADAGLLAKMMAKFSCKKDSCCEPAPCCEPEPVCPCEAAPVVEDCGCSAPVEAPAADCGCNAAEAMIVEGAVMEASPAEVPTPADPAPEAPMKKEGSGTKEAMMKKEGSGSKEAMTEKQMKIEKMKMEAAAAVKKAAGESVGAAVGSGSK